MKRKSGKKKVSGSEGKTQTSPSKVKSVLHGDPKLGATSSKAKKKEKLKAKGAKASSSKFWISPVQVALLVAAFAIVGAIYDQISTVEPTPVGKNTTLWTETSSSTAKKILLACHRNLVWYDVEGDRYTILNDEHLIYYGMFPADDEKNTLWVISSKLETRKMQAKQDQLLHLDANTGKILEIKPLPSMFTHDAVRSPDGSKVFVADTFHGSILVYSFHGFELLRTLKKFSRDHHINTLSPTEHGTLWVLLLNRKGKSFMVELDVETGDRRCIVKDLGDDCHGLVQLKQHPRSFLMLSSSEAALIKVRIPSYCDSKVAEKADRVVLWQYRQSTVQKMVNPKFLKGLAVVDNVAYFGMSDYEGSRQARMALKCSLLAYDLHLGKLLWIREEVGTKGLINVISAPHLAIAAPYQEQVSQLELSKTAEASPKKAEAKVDKSCEEGYMKSLAESKHFGPAFGMPGPGVLFIELPLRFDVPQMLKETKALEKEFGWTFRPDVNNYFILLVTRLGDMRDQSNYGPFYPVANRLERSPYLRKVFDSFKSVIGRSRFMQLKAGKELTRHYDRTDHVYNGKANPSVGYWGRRFRVHIPVVSDHTVVFRADDAKGSAKIHMKVGHAYLFDNSVFHSVSNPSKIDRLHLIFDTIGSAELFRLIQKSRVVLANSVFANYPDTDPQAKAEEIFVPPEPQDDDIELIYENWTDVPVFRPMRPDLMDAFLNNNLLPMVQEESKYKVRMMFKKFPVDWKEDCFAPWYRAVKAAKAAKLAITDTVRRSELACKEMAMDFLRRVLRVDICAAKPIELRFKSSMSVSTIVESFSRMLFYECSGLPLYSRYYVEGPPCQIHRNLIMDEIRGAFL